VLGELDRADRAARLGLADRDGRPAGRGPPEVLVERDDAVHLGDREVQDVGDHRDIGLIDVPELLLHRVQDRYQRTAETAEFLRELPHALGSPGDRDRGSGHDLTRHVYNIPSPLRRGQSNAAYQLIGSSYHARL